MSVSLSVSVHSEGNSCPFVSCPVLFSLLNSYPRLTVDGVFSYCIHTSYTIPHTSHPGYMGMGWGTHLHPLSHCPRPAPLYLFTAHTPPSLPPNLSLLRHCMSLFISMFTQILIYSPLPCSHITVRFTGKFVPMNAEEKEGSWNRFRYWLMSKVSHEERERGNERTSRTESYVSVYPCIHLCLFVLFFGALKMSLYLLYSSQSV